MLKNTVFLCVISLLLTALVDCQNGASNSHKIKEYYSNKCFSKTGNHSYYVKLEDEFTKFAAYFDSTFSMIPERRKSFCDDERIPLNDGFHRVLQFLKPCLHSEEKYLPDFLKTSLREFLHFLCHNNGEYTTRLFSPQNQQCLPNLGGNLTSRLVACFGRIFKPRNSYLKQTELCEDMSVAEKCFDAILAEKCSTYSHLSKKFFHYISKPCSGCVTKNINILLLILSVVLSYLFSKK